MAEQSRPRDAVGHRLRATARLVAGAAAMGVLRTARATRHTDLIRVRRRAGAAAALLAVSVTGVVLGVALLGRTNADIGPFQAEMSITPSLYGDTEVDIPPLGSLHVDSHEGPAHLKIQLGALDHRRTEALVADPNGIVRASDTAVVDVEEGVSRLVLRTLGASVLGALVLGALVVRKMRRVAWSGGLGLLVTAVSLGTAVTTFQPSSIEEPRYEGLLVNAPAVVGDARRIANRYDEYAAQLQKLVTNVGQIYSTVSTLPVFPAEEGTTRVLHVSDLHLNPTAWPVIKTVVGQFSSARVIDQGDINDWGCEREASYVSAIGGLGVPYVYIQGNHDSGVTAATVGRQRNAVVLNNATAKVAGLTIAGIADP